MKRQLLAATAVVALSLFVGETGVAQAQTSGGTATPPAGASPPAATTPPATTAPATTTPAQTGQSSDQLPEVQVIQEQPKPKVKPKPVVAKKPKPKPAPQPQPEPVAVEAPPVEGAGEPVYAQPEAPQQVKLSPIGDSAVPIAKVPSGVTSLSSADIKRDESVIPQDTLQQRVPGVIIGDLQGNQFQTNVQYRGFESSPVNGVAQGLAVYQNGVRINESFGDTVNWDFLPTIAINDLTVMSSNPIFGLNAIGGAISLGMKDGFNFQGGTLDTRFGSFGRKQVGVEAGAQSGPFAFYGAFEGIDDDGFRDFSDAEVRRGYADLGLKTDNAEFHFNFTGADNHVGVTAAVPEELLAVGGWSRTFTSPQTTDNQMQLYSLNGTVRATDTLSFSGVGYYRRFKQKHDDGNIAETEECDNNPGLLCVEEGVAFGQGPGVNADGTIPFDDNALYGTIDRTGQDANSYGVALQATDTSRLFGLRNKFTFGGSYDHGRVGYTANSELGLFQPRFVVAGTGIHFVAPPDDDDLPPGVDEDDTADDVTPRNLTTLNDYYGLYFINTVDLTDQLSLTFGGRYNYARIEIKENTGVEELAKLNGVNTFERFNPTVGLTYEFSKALSVYGGYSEANRAPTPAEIACSDPETPCIIESFLTADPPLEQVVSKTWEFGFRGQNKLGWSGKENVEWSLGYFHALNTNDILSVADETSNGRGYFINAGDTLRQGVEASIAYRSQRLFAYASYAYVDATFRDTVTLASPDNPSATPCPVGDGGGDDDDEGGNCVTVSPGDRLAGIPRHRLKLGADYWITPQWKFGADLVALSNQIFFGDESNLNRPLAGFSKVNLHTSYDITNNIQVYGLIENLFDQHYGVYGTYFNAEAGNIGAEADGLGDEFFNENGEKRSITPAIPFAAYGGVKIKF